MKPLDEGQQRELDYLRAHGGRRDGSRRRRGAVGAALGLVIGASVAPVLLLIGAPWWLIVGTVLGLTGCVGAVHVLVKPDVLLELSVRSWVPTREAMTRGEGAFQRAGSRVPKPGEPPTPTYWRRER